MAAAYTFVNEADVADGSGSYDFDDGTNTRILERGIVGMGPPPLALRMDSRSGVVGSQLRTSRMGSRTVVIPVIIQGSSVNDTNDRVRSAVKYMAGSYGRDEPRFGQLRVTANGDTQKYLRCICVNSPRDYGTVLTGTKTGMEFAFYADHPNWYDPTEQTSTITVGSGAGMPWQFPHNWGLDGATGGATIANDGDAETRSLLVSVTAGSAGITNPGIQNLTLAGSPYVRLEGLTLADGETLKIRMGWRPDGVAEHKAVVVDAQGDEQSVMGYLETNSEFFHLEPGNNDIVVVQDTPSSGTQWSLGWYEEFFAL